MKQSIKDKEKIIVECINNLRKYNENGIDQFIVEDGLSIPEELSDDVEKLLNTIKTLSHEQESDNTCFINQYFEETEERFCNFIKDYIDYRNRISKELSMICNISEEEFKSLFKHTLENYVLERNDLQAYSNFSENQIKVAIKVINTSIHLIVEELLSEKSFLKEAMDIFEIAESNCLIIWNLINGNKNELRYISIIRRLKG